MSCTALYRVLPWLLLSLLTACGQKKDRDKIDWSVTLDHESKSPYASSIAFETLPQYFPAARRESLSRWFRYTGVDEKMRGGDDSVSLLVMLGLNYFVRDDEWISILRYAQQGNEVFLLAAKLDVHALRSLHCQKGAGGGEEYPPNQYKDGSLQAHPLKLMPDTAVAYGYAGREITAYFELNKQPNADSLQDGQSSTAGDPESKTLSAFNEYIDPVPEILGTTAGQPDFVRYRVGNGHITLHAAPLVLSNYFLLQPGNRAYLDAIWHNFPANVSAVYWNEYYKRTTESSGMTVLFKYPATRWALIIAACTLLLYVVFGLKRLQRVVPIVPPVANASVSFVETVGRLYFNKGNHANLAEKMVQHFLEWVRAYYYLDTAQLNNAFIRQLAAKSGKPEAEVAVLINSIHDLRLSAVPVTPEQLYTFYHSIQSFYKTR